LERGRCGGWISGQAPPPTSSVAAIEKIGRTHEKNKGKIKKGENKNTFKSCSGGCNQCRRISSGILGIKNRKSLCGRTKNKKVENVVGFLFVK
jgi:hypothetical protein